MEKLSHLDKVINEEVLRVNEDRRNTELLSGKGNISVLFCDMTAFYVKLLKAE